MILPFFETFFKFIFDIPMPFHHQEIIYSKINPGQYSDFEETIQILVVELSKKFSGIREKLLPSVTIF